MSNLNSNFDFFNYSPKKVSNARKTEIELTKSENIIKTMKKLERRAKREKYNKALSIRLG